MRPFKLFEQQNEETPNFVQRVQAFDGKLGKVDVAVLLWLAMDE